MPEQTITRWPWKSPLLAWPATRGDRPGGLRCPVTGTARSTAFEPPCQSSGHDPGRGPKGAGRRTMLRLSLFRLRTSCERAWLP